MTTRLHVDWTRCDGHGSCAELLPELLGTIVAISEEHDVEIPTVAHAGDGNTHPLIVYDAADPDSERRARVAFDQVMSAAIAIGGTITGEHGVGVLKSRWLADELGEDQWEIQRQILAVFDPQRILNPGKVYADA